LKQLLKKGQPALILAPMEGVTDYPMRALLTELGGYKFCVSEFVRVTHEVPPDHVFYRFVPELKVGGKTASDIPVVVQILGGDPARMAKTALRLIQLGALGIDINFGCPAPTVNRHDGGAAILKEPHRVREIVGAVRAVVPSNIPVSAKVRLGWEKVDEIHSIAEAVVLGGASWITIHARTRAQGYAKPVHWKMIGEVNKRLSIPVVANGDICSIADFRMCREETGCEHYMIGRGALGEPALARSISRELGIVNSTESSISDYGDSKELWFPLFQRFVELGQPQAKSPDYTTKRIKQWLNLASKTRTIEWAGPIMRASNLTEVWQSF
jgi:tRNA-dihydrouridine synthase C